MGDRVKLLEAVARLREVVQVFAQQKTFAEMTDDEARNADTDGAYDMMIEEARVALAIDALNALDALPARQAETVDIRAVCLQAIADKLASVPKPRSYEMAHYCMGLEDAAMAIQSKITVTLPLTPEVTP